MYPLRFEPFFQRYIWGGRGLASTLNKPIGDQTAAESWEIVDHRDGQSVVANGPLAGKTLHELVVEYDDELVGPRVWSLISDTSLPPNLRLRFPLLMKFLDAQRSLSVQVHPDDALGAKLDPPDLGKTEAWYVLDVQPGAKIFAGLKSGVTRDQFAAAIEKGEVEPLLHSFEPQRGDCVFIEAGTMHAIGAGLLIAEIQQASNTTYRVFDWNRVDAEGNSRPLHVDLALAATHFDRGPVSPTIPSVDSSGHQTLVDCDQFVMQRWELSGETAVDCDGEFKIVVCTRGAVEIVDNRHPVTLNLGQTVLLPASLGKVCLRPLGVGTGANAAEVLVIAGGNRA